MRLGALLVPGDGSSPHSIADQSRLLESVGYESIWSAQAIGRGFMMHDPFVALATAAAVTEKVELGIAILQLPLYNAADVALKSFSLSQVSGCRFLLGVGSGSTANDFELHQQDFGERFKLFDIRLDELKKVFSTGVAGGRELTPWGSVVSGPPIFYGTWGSNVQRAALECDGWIASGMHRTPTECGEALKVYRGAGGGRAIVSTIRVMPGDDLGALRDDLSFYSDAGFDDAVVMVFPGSASLDEVRALVK